jgi:curli production assembly/transport component CsgG/holdfast attachment protein HfaB
MNIKPIIGTLTAIGIVTLSGCGGIPGKNALRDGDRVPTVKGSYVTDNDTPYTDALHCVGGNIARAHPEKTIRVSLAGIPDRTGKVSNQDGGYKATQGAESMAYSALGKIGPQVLLVERTYTEVFNFELKLAGDKLLGDHKEYVINNGEQKRKVNWRPVMTGSVVGSDLFIAGAITELNYNIASGGIEAGVEGYFGRARTYQLNVGLDLRIVDTRTLEIVHTTSLQKQIVGYEVEAGLFRFFGTTLFDLNLGEKSDEPIHMGIRSVIESAIVELVAAVYGVEWKGCIRQAEGTWDTDGPSPPYETNVTVSEGGE